MTRSWAVSERRRRGLALIVALAVLALVTLLASTLIQGIGHERRASQATERQAQADWLVRAGADRVRARLAQSGEYQGETWDIPAGELDGRNAARVVIAVADAKNEGASARKRVTIRAEFPREELLQARRSRSFTVIVGRPPTGAEP